MPLLRRPIPLVALAAALALAPRAAAAEGFADDVVPGIRHAIPSAKAEEIAPRYRAYRSAQAPAKAPARPSADAGLAVAPADAAEGTSGPIAAPAPTASPKPGVPAAEASPNGRADGTGEQKSPERLPPTPTAAAAAPAPASEIPMVRVPAPIVKAARKALPGIVFKSVGLSRSGTSTVYGLSGTSESGRAVLVELDQAARVMKVDRQARDTEVPAEVMVLVEAVLPGARIERAMLSLRPGFAAFYSFTGTSSSDEPFTLDIRSDGRSLAFVDPE